MEAHEGRKLIIGLYRPFSAFPADIAPSLEHALRTIHERRWAMSAPAKTPEIIDPLLYPAHVAKLLGLSLSWLAKSRLNGTGPRFIKIGRAVRYAKFRRARIRPKPPAQLHE
jgi:hypothetical protein